MNLANLDKVMTIAMANAREGITISDANQPDNPLIYVNQGFLDMTGYGYDEVINRNCRFLHGHLRQQPGLDQLRTALHNGEHTLVEIQNFRKNGTQFWNRLSVTPVFDADGNLNYFIGIQEDITAQKEHEALTQALREQQLVTEVAREVQEQERRYIGAELHDNVNQLLATARLYLNIDVNNNGREAAVAKAKQYLDDAVQEIRRLSAKLVHQEPQSLPLGKQLEQLVASLRPVVPFRLQLGIRLDGVPEPDERHKMVFYRIVQEQLNNIIKYARAKTVEVMIQAVAGTLLLEIADDGVGFSPVGDYKGIGFANMRSRMQEVGGSLVIEASPGAGCRIKAIMPY